MAEALNLNSLSVDTKTGRVSFSGLSSGIDFQAAVDGIIAAKRIPVDRLEAQITSNKDKITALQSLRTGLTALKDALAGLRGAVSIGNQGNAFEAKQAFTSTSRADGAIASQAGNLIGATVSNAASSGNHTIEVLQTAKAHKLSSDKFTSAGSPLGFNAGDSFAINGKTIAVGANDSLSDLRDRINNANKGTNPTGVTAAIVTVGPNENYLFLTADKTGQTISLADTAGTPLQAIGILNGSGGIKNELQAAQTAKFHADGLLDLSNLAYETDFQSSGAVQAGSAGTLTFRRDSDNAVIGTVNYVATDTLADIAARITTNVTGTTGAVVSDGTGVRLEITGATAFSIEETGGGTAIDDLGIDNKRRVIERQTNTISDLFAGVTLSLYQAEKGTTVSIDIDHDLNAVKTQITNFVNAYNAVRSFINEHVARDPTTGELVGENPVLNTSQALREASTQISALLGNGVDGVSQGFRVLAQIGVTFIPREQNTDPLLDNTLRIDDSKIDTALLANLDDVRRLFAFDFSASDPRVSLLGFDRNTKYNPAGYVLNLQPNSGSNMLANSEAADDPSWTATRATVAADGMAAPDGTMTADGLVGDAANDTHYLSSPASLALTAGQTYSFSTYVKAGAQSDARIAVAGGAVAGDAFADFDLANGTVSGFGTGIDDAAIESVGNGWYRISIAATATASGNVAFERHATGPGGATYSGDGATPDAWFWGAQAADAGAEAVGIANLNASAATVNADAVTGPDGAMTGDELVGDVTAGPHYVSNADAVSVTAGKSYTLVGYAKAGAQDSVRFAFEGAGFSADTYADFNVATGTVGATAGDATGARIDDMGNGWYRIEVSATAVAAGSGDFRLYSADSATGTNVTGDGATPDTLFADLKLVPQAVNDPPGYVKSGATPAVNVPATGNVGGTADGADDGSVSISNQAITILTGEAKGLKLFYNGVDLPTSIQLDYTVGMGAEMFAQIENLLDSVNGVVETEIDTAEGQNTLTQTRIDEMQTRLDYQREQLTARFIRMESALAAAQSILDSIKQTTEAMFQSR
ncbi:MAG: flagellar filament capping protein FliD [Rhodospirillales bacterium]